MSSYRDAKTTSILVEICDDSFVRLSGVYEHIIAIRYGGFRPKELPMDIGFAEGWAHRLDLILNTQDLVVLAFV